jgi:precorrin-4 methylase
MAQWNVNDLVPCIGLLAFLLRNVVAAAEGQDNSSVLLQARPQLLSADTPDTRVCVVIRTYWKHGSSYTGSLDRLLDSLRRQTLSRCCFWAWAVVACRACDHAGSLLYKMNFTSA